jgi:GMP synthase PP-ATPase subunit
MISSKSASQSPILDNSKHNINKNNNKQEFKFLAQGTLYPDVVESSAVKGGTSQVIKSHHNVGGLPEDMKFELVEPFRELFKDEVREVGRRLGVPDKIVDRHPFPGPGLAIRIIGEITKEKLEILRLADKIFIDELKNTLTDQVAAKQLQFAPYSKFWSELECSKEGGYYVRVIIFDNKGRLLIDNLSSGDTQVGLQYELANIQNFNQDIGNYIRMINDWEVTRIVDFWDKEDGENTDANPYIFVIQVEGDLNATVSQNNLSWLSENEIDNLKGINQKSIANKFNSEKWFAKSKKTSLYHDTWQAFCVLTPVQTVGVMGDGRTYENVLGIRAVTAADGMTADWARLPYDFLANVSNKIINQVKGVNRVVYDISSKPPATIEWE